MCATHTHTRTYMIIAVCAKKEKNEETDENRIILSEIEKNNVAYL